MQTGVDPGQLPDQQAEHRGIRLLVALGQVQREGALEIAAGHPLRAQLRAQGAARIKVPTGPAQVTTQRLHLRQQAGGLALEGHGTAAPGQLPGLTQAELTTHQIPGPGIGQAHHIPQPLTHRVGQIPAGQRRPSQWPHPLRLHEHDRPERGQRHHLRVVGERPLREVGDLLLHPGPPARAP